jgi:hypothetical protein
MSDVQTPKITVKSSEIYLARPLRADETPSEGYRRGKIPDPDLHNHEIESHANREYFLPNEADLAIIVEAGDELGDIGICVQYEGQIVGESKQLADQCVDKQSDAIQDAAGWLNDILSQFDTDWEARVYSAPCPVADEKLQVVAAVERLTGVAHAVKVKVDPGFIVEPKRERGV